jgi:hypothetical protein
LIVTTLALLMPTLASAAEQVLKELTWEKAPDDTELVSAASRPTTRDTASTTQMTTKPASVALKVTSDAKGKAVTVFIIEDPAITSNRYAVTGQVRYESVRGRGYLEMWNNFPDGGAFFSRTLGSTGPMAAITGTSRWRAFLLPFTSNPGYLPNELVVNVVLAGKGTVYLRNLKLVQYPATGATTAPAKADSGNNEMKTTQGSAGKVPARAWWSDQQGGYAGAVAGSLLGGFGGLLGILVSRGRGKHVVMAMSRAVIAAGAAAVVAGIVAVLAHQPYGVYYPLLLGGVMAGLLPLLLLPAITRRYEQTELRRISAMDVM